jgi:DNA-binding response OmpR family regulator
MDETYFAAAKLPTASASGAGETRVQRVRALIVEDDRVVGNAVERALSLEGYVAHHVESAEQAKVALHFDDFDFAIIDIGLPGEDGLQLVQHLRRNSRNFPVLMLTARDGPSDRATALAFGANDYMTKPFQIVDLLARCRALVHGSGGAARTDWVLGSLKLDIANKRASLGGAHLDLTAHEWSILEYLVLNAGRIVSKEKLISVCELSGNPVEDVIARLQGKLREAAMIRVIRGMGYRLDERKH